MNPFSHIVPPISALIVILLTWQFCVGFLGISQEILPPPWAVCEALLHDRTFLLQQAGITAAEAGIGLILGGTAAIMVAILFARSDLARRAGYPYVIAFKAIPLVVLAPLTELWFPGLASKAVLAALISFFPVLVAAFDGLQQAPRSALALMTALSAGPWQTIAYLRLPYALPAIFSGLRVSSTFAVIGAVVAEFVASDRGIGHVINSTHYYLQTAQTFAAIVVAAGLGIGFFLLVQVLEHVVVPWAREPASRDL